MFSRKFLGLRPDGKNHRHVDPDDGDAFLPDFRHGFVPAADGDAEAFGEEFIVAATSAEGVGEEARDEVVDDEELGGLTIETSFDDADDDLGAFDGKPS